jgi:L-lysine 2,3-aminomutase
MMRIFIVYQQRLKKIKILERPLLFVTDDYKYWCRYCFRSWKRKLFSKLGFKKKYWVKNETH